MPKPKPFPFRSLRSLQCVIQAGFSVKQCILEVHICNVVPNNCENEVYTMHFLHTDHGAETSLFLFLVSSGSPNSHCLSRQVTPNGKHAAFPRLEGWTAEDSVKVWALLNIQQCLEAVANLLVITSVFYHSKSKSRLDLDAEGPSSHAFGVICYVHSYSCSHTCAHDCGYD